MSQVADRLGKLGLTIPEVAAPVAAYVPAVQAGNFIYTSGQLPFVDGALQLTGKVGDQVSAEAATEAAQHAALNAIAALGSVVDLDQVERIVKAVVFVSSATDFTGQPAVANGASELFAAAFGDAGQHARSAVGVAVLPLDSPVEVELIAQVR